jgi:hypothetical protein
VIARLREVAHVYDRWFEGQDVVVSPVLGLPPVPLGYVSGDVPIEMLGERLAGYVGYTSLHNVAGAPAMSVPLHWTADGLPIGVQVAARVGDERSLLELAFELEAGAALGRAPPAGARVRRPRMGQVTFRGVLLACLLSLAACKSRGAYVAGDVARLNAAEPASEISRRPAAAPHGRL